jgi:hypothetical protein
MPPVKLEIILDRTTGQLTVNGPIRDKIFCYGILRAAEKVIEEYQPDAVVVPGNGLENIRIGDFADAKITRRK